ncbi:MAG: hypothetical protein IJE60_06985 [Tyzzerella sp.]|nr:hypothetical protein [Tyzzerella sp.]
MKKKYVLYVLIPLICIIGAFLYVSNLSPKGDTIESREALLNNAILGSKDWTIIKENKIDDYIISCAYSAKGQSTIAVFEPMSNKKYKFSTSTNRDNTDIIIGGTIINGEWYDLIWFNGAQTEYAEIIYTVNGAPKEPLKYDTTNMDLIYIKNSEKDYSIDVCYYDSDGKRYE